MLRRFLSRLRRLMMGDRNNGRVEEQIAMTNRRRRGKVPLARDVLFEVSNFLTILEIARLSLVSRHFSRVFGGEGNPIVRRPRRIPPLLFNGFQLHTKKRGPVPIARGPLPANIAGFDDIRFYSSCDPSVPSYDYENRPNANDVKQTIKEFSNFLWLISPLLGGHMVKLVVQRFPDPTEPKKIVDKRLKQFFAGIYSRGFAGIRIELDMNSTEFDFSGVFETKAFRETPRIRVCHRFPRSNAQWRVSRAFTRVLVRWLFDSNHRVPESGEEKTLLLKQICHEEIQGFIDKIRQHFLTLKGRRRRRRQRRSTAPDTFPPPPQFRVFIVVSAPHHFTPFSVENQGVGAILSLSLVTPDQEVMLWCRRLQKEGEDEGEGELLASGNKNSEEFDVEERTAPNVVGVYWQLKPAKPFKDWSRSSLMAAAIRFAGEEGGGGGGSTPI